MKIHFPLAIAATTLVLHAQQAFQTEVLLIEREGGFRRVWLTAATKTQIRYREYKDSMDTKDENISKFSAVYILEPDEFFKAMDLYEAGKYKEARVALAKVSEQFKPIRALDNNPSTLAAFHEMECMRKMGDLDALSSALGSFIKDPLTRESQLRQIELYALWDAARTKSWDRLDILARQRVNEKLPGDQRAQVGYLHGLALDGLKRPEEALFAYQIAMTAEAGASAEIARDAALRVLAIHMADHEVRQAINVWGTPDENKNSNGYDRLSEAGAVATLYEISHGAEFPLPAAFKPLLQYKPKEHDAVAPDY